MYKSFLQDPLLIEKEYFSKKEISQIKFIDKSKIKLLEILKLVITEIDDNQSSGSIARKINKKLNKD